MSRYAAMFDRLNTAGQGGFVPFVTLGDPNPELSLKIIDCLVENGADALELGFPFSDPLADGPVIQAANQRARQAGTKISDCFKMLVQIRLRYPKIPIGLLLYANLVYSNGLDQFYQKAKTAGVDSVLIADVPLHEASPFIAAAKANNIAPIFIAPPNADCTTLKQVAQLSEGYTYLLSRAGVTGTDVQVAMPVDSILAMLNEYNAPPPLLGFGIANPEQVRAAIEAGAAGAISGSAVVKIIETHQQDSDACLLTLAAFIKSMKAGTRIDRKI